MRIKKAKYISTLLVLSFFGGVVFSRGNSGEGVPDEVGSSSVSNLATGDSAGYVPEDAPLVISPDGGTVSGEILSDTLSQSSPVPDPADSMRMRERKPFIDDIITGKNQDSLVYDLRSKTVYIYEKGDLDYQEKNIQGDFMRIKLDEKLVYAHGREDTVAGKPTRAVFTENGQVIEMDTVTYNLETGKGNIRGGYTQQGEGFLTGARIKKMPGNVINIADGKYTTCDADHPHFYLAMTKAKTIPGKKVIIGPTYLVMEDVPIYFLGLPFGFFPMNNDRSAGFIMPEFGEEVIKGFFLRNGGYYLTFKDYADVALTAGVYTYGSWEASLASRYIKRYKFNGGLNVQFSKVIIGDKGSADYQNQNNFQVQWTHAQDQRARPNSSFSASVNFSTSGYNKYSSQTMNDYLNTQTNSSVAYSKNWTGKPFTFSTNFSHSQNSRDSTVSLGFPNVVFNVSRINPFKGKQSSGQKWYEKISTSYNFKMENSVMVKEKELFTPKMYDEMKNGVMHTIPIQATFNLLKYINVSPSANYNERWYFQKVLQEWNGSEVVMDTVRGFNRVYDYNFSISASTKLYGTYRLRKKDIPVARHVITPTMGFSYRPDFGDPKYGYYKTVVQDNQGRERIYSPYDGAKYGVPGRGKSAGLTFGLQQSLEMKVPSKTDTSGFKKIKLIDNLNISSSYNFVADSLNLSPFSITFRSSLIKNFGINLSATLDPYQVDRTGRKINKFMLSDGKLGRISSASTSFGYSFKSSTSGQPAMNDINSGTGQLTAAQQSDFFAQTGAEQLSADEQRRILSSMYYDFSIPWNFGFNYSLSYSNTGITQKITQTLGFNVSVNLTEKWGITIDHIGYDFEQNKLTPGTITMTRDLHCWQMNFSWVPIGYRKSWSFNIAVKSSLLKDLKYDRNSSYYDNLYDF